VPGIIDFCKKGSKQNYRKYRITKTDESSGTLQPAYSPKNGKFTHRVQPLLRAYKIFGTNNFIRFMIKTMDAGNLLIH
jgi:hypothetical protein